MSVKIECNGKTANDCWECGRYYSSHSLHFCRMHNKKVQEVTCDIGGNRTFDEDGVEL